jgi:hypothetical protein
MGSLELGDLKFNDAYAGEKGACRHHTPRMHRRARPRRTLRAVPKRKKNKRMLCQKLLPKQLTRKNAP